MDEDESAPHRRRAVGTAQRRFLLALFQQLAKTVKIDPRNIRGQPFGQPGTRWL
ncbi:hypothetical protein A6C84_001181 [Escherichia coli]